MKTRLLTVAAVLMAVLGVLPTSANAYEVVETSAVRLTPEHTMMTITYRFGFLNREYRMPLFADRTNGGRGTTVGYNLVNRDGKVISEGKTAALVFAKAEVINRAYQLPQGRNTDFTFVAFVRTTGITEDFSLHLTRLPFTLIDRDVTIGAAVTDKDLARYQTEFVR